MSKNKATKDQLKVLYGCRCMLTLLKDNLTYHHIDKEADGGPTTIENGALAEEYIHIWLTEQERLDPEIYDLVNECLLLYKICLDNNEEALIKQYEEECVPLFLEKRKKTMWKVGNIIG